MGEDLASSVEEYANWCSYNPYCCVFEYSPSIPGQSKGPEGPFRKELKKCCSIMQVLVFHIRLHPLMLLG